MEIRWLFILDKIDIDLRKIVKISIFCHNANSIFLQFFQNTILNLAMWKVLVCHHWPRGHSLYLSIIHGLSDHVTLSDVHRLPQLTIAIELVSEISRQLNDRKNEAVTEINSTFEELERALHQRRTALITDLENICCTKQKVGRSYGFIWSLFWTSWFLFLQYSDLALVEIWAYFLH